MKNELRKLIDYTLDNKDTFGSEDILKQLGKARYMSEFRTLKVSTPRRIGKTSLLRALREREKSCLIVYSPILKKELNRENVYSANEITMSRLRGKEYSIVLVDEPALCEKTTKNFFYNLYSQLPPEAFVICLGTD